MAKFMIDERNSDIEMKISSIHKRRESRVSNAVNA